MHLGLPAGRRFLLQRNAAKGEPAGVEVLRPLLLVLHPHHHRRRVGQGAEPLLALPDRRIRPGADLDFGPGQPDHDDRDHDRGGDDPDQGDDGEPDLGQSLLPVAGVEVHSKHPLHPPRRIPERLVRRHPGACLIALGHLVERALAGERLAQLLPDQAVVLPAQGHAAPTRAGPMAIAVVVRFHVHQVHDPPVGQRAERVHRVNRGIGRDPGALEPH
jgi:hypothetical protein